ncbi:MAG: hypothetical protein ACFFDI_28845 [Promethearchaeota archaeon]
MMSNGFELINEISVNFSKILLVIGLIFVVLKIIEKILNNQTYSAFYERIKLPLYYLHKACPALATILAFIHGFVYFWLLIPVNQTYIITGWLLGIAMLVLSILGVILGFKNDWKPFDEAKDSEWKIMRTVKWILTICVFLFLILHYLEMIQGSLL